MVKDISGRVISPNSVVYEFVLKKKVYKRPPVKIRIKEKLRKLEKVNIDVSFLLERDDDAID